VEIVVSRPTEALTQLFASFGGQLRKAAGHAAAGGTASRNKAAHELSPWCLAHAMSHGT
jgi:hypothetical protein